MGTRKQIAAGYRRARNNAMTKARKHSGQVRQIFVQHARQLHRYALEWSRTP